jgi:hypothetical protein
MSDWSDQWAEYRRWAETQSAADLRSPAAIMADVEVLYSSYPESVRRTDPDPGKLGIQQLRRAFALYQALYERKFQSRDSAPPSR